MIYSYTNGQSFTEVHYTKKPCNGEMNHRVFVCPSPFVAPASWNSTWPWYTAHPCSTSFYINRKFPRTPAILYGCARILAQGYVL